MLWISGGPQRDGLDVVTRETDVRTAGSFLCCKVRLRIPSGCEMMKVNHVCIFVLKLVAVVPRTRSPAGF